MVEPESLNVVEDEPRQRDEHEHDEGDGDEEHRRLLLDVEGVVLHVAGDVPVPERALLLQNILQIVVKTAQARNLSYC